MNERYQKNTSPAGKTRRSAAAAKPKRDAGGRAKQSAKSTSRSGSRPPLIVNPPTPEFRRWRKIWWWLLGGSLVMTMGSIALRKWTGMAQLSTITLTLGYMMIFAALYIDWTILRRMRTAWVDASKKSGKSASEPDSTGEKGSE